jgi:hypothetical protein
MSKHWNAAKREVFTTVPETCPGVGKALETALDRLGVTRELLQANGLDPATLLPALMEIVSKQGTIPLRDHWIDAVEARMAAEERAEQLSRELDAASVVAA